MICLQTPKIFSQLLNVHGVNDIRQIEIHTAEPLVPEPSVSEVELNTEKLKRHKLPGTDQILEEIIKEGVEQFALRSIHLLILFGISRYCLRSGRSPSFFQSLRRTTKQIIVIIEAFHFCQLRKKFLISNFRRVQNVVCFR